MKKPIYQKGDYIEFKTPFGLKKGFIKIIIGSFVIVVTRKGSEYVFNFDIDADMNSVFRKLPISRDKNGRFSSKNLGGRLSSIRITDGKGKTLYENKACSYFNCNQCAEKMRAYYEKTGKLAKEQKEEFGFEEKKPSERIEELVHVLETRDKKEKILVAQIMAIFGKVLDEQWEKGRK